jgi:AraC-like DNA-binding protein
MLGLSSIADDLGVSNSYISRVFKKIYHIGVVEYINKTRIDHAKELIVKGDMSMKAIAIKVGFSSDVSFIRVFKKYERITPGKYKQ